jgi:hypothetical protein
MIEPMMLLVILLAPLVSTYHRYSKELRVFVALDSEADMRVMIMLIDPIIRTPSPSLFRRADAPIEDDVRHSLIARLCSESNLIDQVRHDIGLPAFAVKVAVNIDGTNPSLNIWIMIRLACSVSSVADPAVRSSISVWECIIDLFSKLDR